MPLKIAISAGELSGDEHAALLVTALREIAPDLDVRGMGGRNLRDAGCELIVDAERSGSLMGFQAVFASFNKIWATFRQMTRLLVEWQPDVLVVVDYPDFNLRLAARARKAGVKVLYYITPKLWAWRSGRVKCFQRDVDRAAVIFPFERNFFQSKSYDRAVFVGHPFTTSMPLQPSVEERRALKQSLGFDPDRPLVALFPGSRRSELKSHLKPMTEGFRRFHGNHPDVQGVIAIASTMKEPEIRAGLPEGVPIRLLPDRSLDILRAADAGILKSGTSNLQAAYCDLPFAMFFIASRFGAWVVRTFVKVREYSLVNVIRRGTIREIIQEDATPEQVCAELETLLYNEQRRREILTGFAEVRHTLETNDDIPLFTGAKSAQERAARMIVDLAGKAHGAS